MYITFRHMHPLLVLISNQSLGVPPDCTTAPAPSQGPSWAAATHSQLLTTHTPTHTQTTQESHWAHSTHPLTPTQRAPTPAHSSRHPALHPHRCPPLHHCCVNHQAARVPGGWVAAVASAAYPWNFQPSSQKRLQPAIICVAGESVTATR